MSAVIPMDECPSSLDTTARSTPAARRSDAAPCLRSCSRMRRTPADRLDAVAVLMRHTDLEALSPSERAPLDALLELRERIDAVKDATSR